MEIGKKLKDARTAAGITQEKVAEEIQVSRQTISNWENEKSYPDIISVIKLSDVYHVSLDDMLKGDPKMLHYLDESTNIVKSNKKLILAFVVNAVFMILLAITANITPGHSYLWVGALILLIISTTILVGQVIRRF